MKHLLRGLLLTAATSAGCACAASAAEVSGDDARAVRAVVEAQLGAIAAEDATRAFSLATPSVRRKFHDAPSFMSMVRRGYPMLVRPSEMLFSQPRPARRGVLQTVHLRDRQRHSWSATYYVLKQGPSDWRIDGCVVEPDAGNASM